MSTWQLQRKSCSSYLQHVRVCVCVRMRTYTHVAYVCDLKFWTPGCLKWLQVWFYLNSKSALQSQSAVSPKWWYCTFPCIDNLKMQLLQISNQFNLGIKQTKAILLFDYKAGVTPLYYDEKLTVTTNADTALRLCRAELLYDSAYHVKPCLGYQLWAPSLVFTLDPRTTDWLKATNTRSDKLHCYCCMHLTPVALWLQLYRKCGKQTSCVHLTFNPGSILLCNLCAC